MNFNKKIFGFTLAEVLITLGIIGVVAALTIPTILNNKAKEETVSKLKKTYTTFSQVVNLSVNDNGPISSWDWGTSGGLSIKQSFETYWKSYLKISKYCTYDQTSDLCGYNSNYPWFYGTNKIASWSGGVLDNNTAVVTFFLADGTFIVINNGNKNVVFDINGVANPNWLGKDVFKFVFDPSKGLVPAGYDQTYDNINTNCRGSSNGSYCAAKIIMDGWQIKSDYPYFN